MTRLKIGHIVETINGVGVVDDIRYIHGEILYLVRTHGTDRLCGGYSDFYAEDELYLREN
jgi:hypothetical protein